MTPLYVRGLGRAAVGIIGLLVMGASIIQHFSWTGLALYSVCGAVAGWGIHRMDRAGVRA